MMLSGSRRIASRTPAGPQGAHITLGADGIHYRQRSGGSLGRSLAVTDDAVRLAPLSADLALHQLNAVSRSGYAWKVAAGGVALALLSLPLHLFVCLLWLCVTPVVVWRVKQADQERRLFSLEYRMEAEAQERWKLLNHALAALARANKTWHIAAPSRFAPSDGQNAAALVKRGDAALRRQPVRPLPSNVTPYCLDAGRQQLFFFPDRLYVRQKGAYEAYDYAGLRLGHGLVRFLEEQEVTPDTQIVGKPEWDRNDANNSSIPMVQYGTLTLTSPAGLDVWLHVSSVGAAEQFAWLFQSFLDYGKPPSSRAASPPVGLSLEECCRCLGLPPSCTKEEAIAKYRRLVLSSHPDRMGQRAPEAQETATAQLQEIIQTFRELKRLRGW